MNIDCVRFKQFNSTFVCKKTFMQYLLMTLNRIGINFEITILYFLFVFIIYDQDAGFWLGFSVCGLSFLVFDL